MQPPETIFTCVDVSWRTLCYYVIIGKNHEKFFFSDEPCSALTTAYSVEYVSERSKVLAVKSKPNKTVKSSTEPGFVTNREKKSQTGGVSSTPQPERRTNVGRIWRAALTL